MVKKTASLALSIFLAAGFSLGINIKQAHAYIDVGSATLYLYMFVATAFGALFMLKAFWQRILGRISRFAAIVRRTSKNS
jgi:hypothetical protein